MAGKLCVHFEVISTPAHGKPLIGVCKYCGKVKNYTKLQNHVPILREGNLLAPGVTMKTLMGKRGT